MHQVFLKNFFCVAEVNLKLLEKIVQPKFGQSVRHYAEPRKRFYKKTNVICNDGKYEVTLDQRRLKTPKGNLFVVESEPLALAVAAEWNAQKNHIIPSSMHLTGLCSTVLDNPNRLTKEHMVNNILKYLDTDTILYTSSEDDELYDLQQKEWHPVVEWFCKKFSVDITPSRSIVGPQITEQTVEILNKYLMSYNFWAIQGFSFAIEALKSVILGISCAERHISVEKAVFLSRLEEEFQSKRWGRFEWSHELNQQDTQARVAAGVLFIYANSSSNIVRNKSKSL